MREAALMHTRTDTRKQMRQCWGRLALEWRIAPLVPAGGRSIDGAQNYLRTAVYIIYKLGPY